MVHFGPGAMEQAAAIADDANIDAVLVDSRTAAAVGGTGVAFDWNEAARTVFNGTPADAACRRGRPDAGDRGRSDSDAAAVGRGCGKRRGGAPGRKDAEKVRAFVANARAAQR